MLSVLKLYLDTKFKFIPCIHPYFCTLSDWVNLENFKMKQKSYQQLNAIFQLKDHLMFTLNSC